VKIAYTTSKRVTSKGLTFPYLRELSSMIQQAEANHVAPALSQTLREVDELNNAYNNQPDDPTLLSIAFRLDVANYIRDMRNQPVAGAAPTDRYTRYQRGVRELIGRLGPGHTRLNEAELYQFQIDENISEARLHGDTEQLRNMRSKLLLNLNQLTHEVLYLSFAALYEQAAAPGAGGLADRRRLLLLIDDVHRMGDATQLLLSHMLSQENLDALFDDVRVVLTYSTVEGDSAMRDQITNWLKDGARKEPMALQKFRAPTEERLAYEHFLRHWRDPQRENQTRLTLVPENIENLNWLLGRLRREVKRIPANLASEGVNTLVRAVADLDGDMDPKYAVLRPYDDMGARIGVI
jgi:hypothetical protein